MAAHLDLDVVCVSAFFEVQVFLRLVVLDHQVSDLRLGSSELGPVNHSLDLMSHQFVIQECRLRMRCRMGSYLEVLVLRGGAAACSLELWTVCGNFHLASAMRAREALRVRSRPDL